MNKELQDFYKSKHLEFGQTSKGVGWDNENVCHTRYKIVESLIDEEPLTIAEFGCGNGISSLELFCYDRKRKYIGIEPMPFYFNAAKDFLGHFQQVRVLQHSIQSFYESYQSTLFSKMYGYDYAICIGVFCLKLEETDDKYYEDALKSIAQMLEMSKVGLIFNAFQDCVDRKDPEQFYFNMPRLLGDLYKLGYSKIELISRPNVNPYEFFIKIIK